MFDINIFKRNIKLQELGIDKLSNREQDILDFLNENLSDLNIYKSKLYENISYMFKHKEDILLKYNQEKNGYLYISYSRIWSFFESKSVVYPDIQELIQWWVINTLHLKVGSISNVEFNFSITDSRHTIIYENINN